MARAQADPVKDLQEELTCPICLDNFIDPVSIQCGHNFCRECISRTWKGVRSNFSCPQCRKVSRWKFLRPNRVVGSVLKISAQLMEAKGGEEHRKQCEKHQEPLKLYCINDAKEICVVCRESFYHRSHTVIPVEETSKEFKGEVQDRMQALRKELASIAQRITGEEEKAVELQAEVLQKRKMVTSGFENLRQLLADEETIIIHRLDNLEKTIKQRRNESVSRLNDQLSSLQKIIDDLEKSFQVSNSPIDQDQKATVGSLKRVRMSWESSEDSVSTPRNNKSQKNVLQKSSVSFPTGTSKMAAEQPAPPDLQEDSDLDSLSDCEEEGTTPQLINRSILRKAFKAIMPELATKLTYWAKSVES
ncbi:E3 ubiquitin-protein ligase TRIM39-like isoform X2 [Hyla sarda]|uniref:E3 ubiquitin-protein ligase TRIM39-like isoform X2 n=1 Tax=Hyla sarda TaxID=327740 RepID=UPI0024C2D995|nr:E3 ubiquitin-protein ligase TRIM39-like isoform X2 [Hyla sarda]